MSQEDWAATSPPPPPWHIRLEVGPFCSPPSDVGPAGGAAEMAAARVVTDSGGARASVPRATLASLCARGSRARRFRAPSCYRRISHPAQRCCACFAD